MARTDADAGPAAIDAGDIEAALAQQAPVRWMGWRLRLLVVAVLSGCLGILLVVRYLAATPALGATWRAGPGGQCILEASDDPALRPHLGQVLLSVVAHDGSVLRADESLLRRSPRWTIDDDRRARLVDAQRGLEQALQRGPVDLQFDGGGRVRVEPAARGVAGLGLLFWPMAGLALLLYLTGAVAWLVRPERRNLLYLAVAVCQALNLLFIGAESAPALPLPGFVVAQSLWLRMGLDLLTVAAILHAMTLHLGRVAAGRWIAAGGWAAAGAALWTGYAVPAPHWWWWAQGAAVLIGVSAIAVLAWSHRLHPNPHTIVMRRFGLVALGSVALVIVTLVAAGGDAGAQQRVVEAGSVIWYVLFASLLLLLPFLSRSRQLLREFALLAGISTVATSLDLLFVALFSLGQFASLALSVFIALGIYTGARQWILDHLTGTSALSLERIFEALYRTAREVEEHPDREAILLLRLLRELFEPLEVLRVARSLAQARVLDDGSALLVPVPPRGGADAAAQDAASTRCWALRFAQRGKRIFTDADARLADRVAEQLRRAIAYDSAVERGRSEERLRIAQDLHDDIGARLLTLMYQSPTPEMEEYLRHTLQDLKTLTRGLAARELRLSHAVAEWKTDIAQRLSAAQIELVWSFAYERDFKLTVVQWSALTRVLRELVTNAIYHAAPSRLEVVAQVDGGQLNLAVVDDGTGREPQAWSHGLGLGGVRKRVKQLGGTVRWRENQPCGIVCDVTIPGFAPGTR